jgi:dTDP-4-dehydrorhamnose 3,5-epimerase-like enzyme
MKEVHLISFPVKGNGDEGHLHIVPEALLPFEIRRVFYTMDTPTGVTRGRHAHHETEMVLIAIKGIIEVRTITIGGHDNTFTLTNASEGLYLPKLCWHEMKYSTDAVQLVICNTLYNEADYIRDWNQFTTLQQAHESR